MDREYRELVRTLKQESPRSGRIGFTIEPSEQAQQQQQRDRTALDAAAAMD
jgi:hypothetical protein